MEIKEQTATAEQKETIRKLHNEESKRVKISAYLIAAVVCIGATFVIRLKPFNFIGSYHQLLNNILYAGAFSFGILIVSRFVQGQIAKGSLEKGLLYNLIQFTRLVTFIIIVFIFISFLNANWYTAAVSLGLISLLLGFALQTPISSLIGWFYIVLRGPFKVGDRIQVGSFNGDVVEINFLDTTLWEFAGNLMTSDLPSGRLIRFPNSLIFQSQVYNYSWQKYPLVWNEISFYITFNSDLDWVEKKLRIITLQQLDAETKEHVQDMRDHISETPVDDIDIKEFPFVNFRIHENNWVEVVLIYIVNPKHSSHMRSKIVKAAITELLREPEKVSFVAEGS
ncbi:mechanosensitive ion channel family protein [Mucilaginibacter auburnensis]|uniref:Mechanosensitive ion channel-like protein n=1 Tax=Mucilaginibacter auburnensis TaxID=1457233 RepID=A0A2H9VM07_9SPHI|nr:mechanosensitive ion channel domain-containing protein [Mucilaginibacter auburnensis]PJJ79377.1 mechanosensitive ion channel-like protein [Mucilaginibacter auburnensis]